jgi:hypothetical protein
MDTRHRDCAITLHKRRCVDRTAQLPDGRLTGRDLMLTTAISKGSRLLDPNFRLARNPERPANRLQKNPLLTVAD